MAHRSRVFGGRGDEKVCHRTGEGPPGGESGAHGELEHWACGGVHNQTQTAEARRLRQSELRPLEGQSPPDSLKTASDVRAVGDGSHHLMFGRAKLGSAEVQSA